MIYTAATTDKLQLITSSAATLDVQANFVEAVKATGAISNIDKQNTAIASAATTDVLAAPASSNFRTLKHMTVRNKDASLPCDVTVQFNQNGTLFEIHKVTLGTGDTLEYTEGIGFFTLTPSAKMDKVLYASSNVVNATTSFADITGLTYALLAGHKYSFEAHLFHINNATTTGSRFGVNIGATPTLLIVGNHSGVTNAVVTGIISLGTATAVDTAITAQTTGSSNITHTIVAGLIVPSADGTFAMRCASEVAVAAGITVNAGSFLKLRETDN